MEEADNYTVEDYSARAAAAASTSKSTPLPHKWPYYDAAFQALLPQPIVELGFEWLGGGEHSTT